MNIMFMAQCYAPENISAAVLITELAADLVKRGHRVTVITSAPNYPLGHVFNGYRNGIFSAEILDGVHIVRTWSYISPSKKFWPRLFHYGTYSVSAFYGGLFAGKPNVLVSYSPPLPLGLSAWLLCRIWNIPWVLQIEDLYPDAAIAAGVLKNKKIIDLFYKIERFLYQHAFHISVISQTFYSALLAKNVPASKMDIIPVWADPNKVRPLRKQNAFRNAYRLDGKFVVLYAGNIGLTSCLHDVLLAAEILQAQPDIQFVIVGEGVKKESLEIEVHGKNLDNIFFLPYQPREIYPEMLAAADIGLVTLNADAMFSSLPSKIFNVMASARPILAISPPESEIARIIKESGCGQNVSPGSPEKLAEAIIALKTDEAALIKMGKNGRSCLEEHYTRDRCINAHEMMLKNLCQEPHVETSYKEVAP